MPICLIIFEKKILYKRLLQKKMALLKIKCFDFSRNVIKFNHIYLHVCRNNRTDRNSRTGALLQSRRLKSNMFFTATPVVYAFFYITGDKTRRVLSPLNFYGYAMSDGARSFMKSHAP